MDAMERGNTSLKKANMYWKILVISLLMHLNGRTKSMKVAPQCVCVLGGGRGGRVFQENQQSLDFKWA